MLQLVVQEEDNSLSFPLGDGEHVVGSRTDCAIVLGHPTVSGQHARLSVDGDICSVEDLGSRNGTKIEGRAITGSQHVEVGERLAFGTRAQRWHLHGPVRNPVVQIAPKPAVRAHDVEVAIGGGDDAHVRASRFATTNPIDLTFLKNSEDLGLSLRGHVANLIQEQSSAIGKLELARPRVDAGGHS